MKQKLSIVLKPDASSSKELNRIMEDISKKYGTYVAVRDKKGPHASFIYMDEKIDDKEIDRILYNIQKKFSKIPQFTVSIEGVKSFRKKYKQTINWVVYARVVKSKNLTKLYRIINYEIKSYKHGRFKVFTPHITLARKDIDQKTFFKIFDEYKGRKVSYKFKLKYLYAMTRRTKKEDHIVTLLKLKG
jgi:2'-5' RNA ligase